MGQSYRARLVAHYGVTSDPRLGAFLLPDGLFLDFSLGARFRTQDHSNVNWVLPRERESRYDGMVRVAKAAKMYRWTPEAWSLEAWTPPTREQLETIWMLVASASLRVEAQRGRWHLFRWYEPWQADEAVSDLRKFFRRPHGVQGIRREYSSGEVVVY